MNERIKELAKQAGMLYTLDPKPTHIDENGTHTFQEINVYKNFDPEKFAELMVKKFDDILMLEQLDCIGNMDKKSAELIEQIRDKTKTYFGVKE